jgi:hypothetical protein
MCHKSDSKNIVTFVALGILSVIIFLMPSAVAQKQIESPRWQISHGILPQNVSCKDSMMLVLKINGKSVACVTPFVANRLVEIGWGSKLQDFHTDGSSSAHVQNKTSYSPKPSDIHLAFFLNTRSPNYDKSLEVLAKNLHRGDYLFIIAHSKLNLTNQLVLQAKNMCVSGVNVNSVLLYSKLSNLISETQNLPPRIDWIIYDYENGPDFSPEFNINETVSLIYFDKAWESVKQYNEKTKSHAKFMVTPPYGELKLGDWDWGVSAKHMDGIDIQTQRLVKTTNAFQNHAIQIANQLQRSPKIFSMIQFSLRPSVGTTQDVITGIGSAKDLGFDAFLIFYDQYSQNSQLDDFFNLLHKSNFTDNRK